MMYRHLNTGAVWRFENGVCSLYDSDKEQTPEHLIIALKLKEGAHGQSV